MTTVFAARRGLQGSVLFVVMLFAAACFGLVVLVSGESLGAWILAVSAVLAGLVILQAMRPGWSYDLGPDGITVHRTLGRVILRREEISSVQAVEGSRVEELLVGPPGMSLRGGIRARREQGRIVALCTAPVVFTQTSVAGPITVRSAGARAHGMFVLVTLANGSVRALSPSDVDGFMTAWQSATAGQGA